MLQLPAILIHQNATDCLSELLQAVHAENSSTVTINAAPLQRFDSTALAVLLELRRCAVSLGKTLTLQAIPPRFADLARLYGIAELLPAQKPCP
ncbi:hypothetical protein MIZ03_3555 [Rhodoferax lithotrophicus]|uniref:STAS domain-containing protein n=1 Tax=Rhodoferax lithotrophicus TaxID=2798804 RepID=A0ABM7MQL3_9BURK|nr:STAS domain-containing protein [Rhodoferax sp. MIZ03]BCO28645.1 hypothetical protein MIZ03_3555 [Rhodoferax sp. MIZ03]